MKIKRLACLLMLMTGLVGCGNKGPLTHPGENPPGDTTKQQEKTLGSL